MGKIKFHLATFQKNIVRANVFDQVPRSKEVEFDFIIFTKPKENYLKDVNVFRVIESFTKKRYKNLHSGIFRIQKGLYYGNNINSYTVKKDFIIIVFSGQDKFSFYLFPSRNPKNKTGFTINFYNQLNSTQ